MAVLTLSGTVLSADTVLTAALFTVNFLQTITTREIDTISLPIGGSFSPSFDQSLPGKFLCVASDQPLTITINGVDVTAQNIALNAGNITSLTLTNLGLAAATVQIAIGA